MLPSPSGGFAQKFKYQDEIDRPISLKIQEISPKSTFWAKPPLGEQLSWLSRVMGIMFMPRGLMFQPGVAHGEQHAHTGGECPLRGCPDRSPPLIKGLEDGIVAHGRQGAHVQHRPDLSPSAPDRPYATPGAAIAVQGLTPISAAISGRFKAPNAGTSATSLRASMGPTPGVLCRISSLARPRGVERRAAAKSASVRAKRRSAVSLGTRWRRRRSLVARLSAGSTYAWGRPPRPRPAIVCASLRSLVALPPWKHSQEAPGPTGVNSRAPRSAGPSQVQLPLTPPATSCWSEARAVRQGWGAACIARGRRSSPS